jgi:hypothetical protein
MSSQWFILLNNFRTFCVLDKGIKNKKLSEIEMVIPVWRRDVVWRHVIMKSSRRHHYYNPYQLIGGEVPTSAYYPVLRPNYYWVQPQLGSYYQQQMPYLMPGTVIMACDSNTCNVHHAVLEMEI